MTEAQEFIHRCSHYRKYARISFRIALFLLLVATAIFLFERVKIITAIVSAVVLVGGGVVLMFVLRFMMSTPIKILKKNEQTEAQNIDVDED